MAKPKTLLLCFQPLTYHHKFIIVSAFTIFALLVSSSSCFSFGFYAVSCPGAELTVKSTVQTASSSDPTLPGKLPRLLFHDCFVEGCDASILIQGEGTEKSDPANKSLGAFSVIDSAKRVLEFFCPGIVSCADILALAARDVVEITGGPSIEIATGRRDGRKSLASNVRRNIVDTSFTMNEMLKIFTAKGLSLDDLVTLSGAHTIGTAHCSAFNDRFKLDSKGNLTLIDKSLDKSYAAQLTQQCPANASSLITVDNDPETPNMFDNQYYKDLLLHKGLFQSDSVLVSDQSTRQKVENFAHDQGLFFESWRQSFLKLSSIGVKTGDEGEIRQMCSGRHDNFHSKTEPTTKMEWHQNHCKLE